MVGHGLTGAHGSGGLASTLGNELGQLRWLRVRKRFVLLQNSRQQAKNIRRIRENCIYPITSHEPYNC